LVENVFEIFFLSASIRDIFFPQESERMSFSPTIVFVAKKN